MEQVTEPTEDARCMCFRAKPHVAQEQALRGPLNIHIGYAPDSTTFARTQLPVDDVAHEKRPLSGTAPRGIARRCLAVSHRQPPLSINNGIETTATTNATARMPTKAKF